MSGVGGGIFSLADRVLVKMAVCLVFLPYLSTSSALALSLNNKTMQKDGKKR
jgi:hypothetical protein